MATRPSSCSDALFKTDALFKSEALVGILADELFGEPLTPVHPVARLGQGLGWLEQHTYRDTRSAGVAHLLAASMATLAVTEPGRRLLGDPASTALSVAVASSGRMLRQVAMTVSDQLDGGDLDAARETVTALVGRDPTNLSEEEIVRAVIESVAENTVDAVTATVFWAGVAGSRGVWIHRMANTLDAMVGHRSARYHRFGWASARTDDLLNWIPARLTAVAVVLAMPSRAQDVVRIVMRDGSDHPSPNGGVVEAAFAAALGVSLGGANNYDGTIEVRGHLGDGPSPQRADIDRSVRLSQRVSWILAALAALAGRRTRGERNVCSFT